MSVSFKQIKKNTNIEVDFALKLNPTKKYHGTCKHLYRTRLSRALAHHATEVVIHRKQQLLLSVLPDSGRYIVSAKTEISFVNIQQVITLRHPDGMEVELNAYLTENVGIENE